MRNALIAFGLLMIVVLTVVIIGNVEGTTTRQNELDTNLGAAMEQSMVLLTDDDESTYKIENREQLIADFIQNFLVKTTSNSTFTIDIITADAEKGLLDVKVTETFGSYGGKKTVSARRTVVVENYINEDDVFYKASFEIPQDMEEQEDNTKQSIVKMVNVHGGDSLAAAQPADPKVEGYKFLGWKCISSDSPIYNSIFTDLSSVNIMGDYTFRAVFEKEPT